MKSIANQYRDLKEGKMSQSNFMRNLRMMVPQYITNVTSFNDAVRILKNKAILTEYSDPKEKHYEGGISEDYDTLDAADSAAEKLAISMGNYEDAIVALEDEMGLSHSAADAIASRVYPEDEDGEIEDMIAKAAEEESGKYTTGLDQFEISEGFYGWDDPSDKTSYDLERLHDYINQKYQKESGEEIPYEAFEEIDAYFRTPEFKKDKSYYFDNSEGLIDHILDKFVRNRGESEDLQENKKENYDKGDLVKYKNFPQGSVKTGKVVKDLGDKVVIFHKEDGVEHTISKDKLVEAKKKKEAKAELHPNQIHPQELRMGIKVELEHTDDLDKAKKIALDHLAENPFYYTALKLSGIESPSAPKVKAPEEKKARKKKEAVELVDKANQMVKVKDTKKKLNEAGGEFMFSGTLNNVEAEELRKIIPGVEIEEEELEDTYKTVISHPTYNEKSLRHAVKQAMGQLPPVGDKKDLGASFDKFKSSLEEVVREVIAEYYDGRDNLDAENEY